MLRKVCALTLLLISFTSAVAGGYDELSPPEQTKLHPILSVNYSYMSISTFTFSAAGTLNGRLPSPYNGGGFFGGFKYGDYFAMIVGYEYYFNQVRITPTPTGNFNLASRPNNFYIEFRGYYPVYIFKFQGLNIVGGIGALINDFSFTSTNMNAIFNGYRSNMNINLRVSIGLNYYFDRHWGLEGMWHYVPNHARNMQTGGWSEFWNVTLGLLYKF